MNVYKLIPICLSFYLYNTRNMSSSLTTQPRQDALFDPDAYPKSNINNPTALSWIPQTFFVLFPCTRYPTSQYQILLTSFVIFPSILKPSSRTLDSAHIMRPFPNTRYPSCYSPEALHLLSSSNLESAKSLRTSRVGRCRVGRRRVGRRKG